MFVVRNVFQCKPGKAGELAERFRRMVPLIEKQGAGTARVLVDTVASFWTVVFEIEVPDLATYERASSERDASAEMRDAMAGYMDLVEGGHREVFRLVDA
jgi:hypothetical protein